MKRFISGLFIAVFVFTAGQALATDKELLECKARLLNAERALIKIDMQKLADQYNEKNAERKEVSIEWNKINATEEAAKKEELKESVEEANTETEE